MSDQLVTAPPSEPVSLLEMKDWLKVDDTNSDGLIQALIASARDYCETYTNRAFVTQQWRRGMDGFPWWDGRGNPDRALSYGSWAMFGTRWGFVLPLAPVQSVDSLNYKDLGGTQQTLPLNTAYTVDVASEPARIYPVFSSFWPLTQYAPNSVAVTYTVGYGIPTFGSDGYPTAWDGEPVPEAIRTAIKFLVSWMFNQRDSQIVTSGVVRDNPTVASLLSQYRMLRA